LQRRHRGGGATDLQRPVSPGSQPRASRRELPVCTVSRCHAEGKVIAALLDSVTEELYARHATDSEAAGLARRDYEERRGRVHQDDELWEAWSAAFVEWYVVERAAGAPADGRGLPLAADSYHELTAANDPRADVVRALITSQRSLFEVKALAPGRIEL